MQIQQTFARLINIIVLVCLILELVFMLDSVSDPLSHVFHKAD